MQKKLIALAVAAALTSPALALADVTFYGKAFLNVESVNNDMIVAPSTSKNSAMRINSNASRLGVKGSEDLGDGLKGIFQYEVQMDANGNAGNGLGNGTRNSGVGLEGGFGKVVMGIWDTPFKVVHNKVELFDNTTSFSSLNLIGRSNGGANANGTVNFNTRQKNMIQYWSPNFSGFQAAVMYSPDSAPTTTTNKQIMSLSGSYEQDAIYAALGYETRADATTAGQTDSATRLTAKYNFGPAWVGATVESIGIKTAAATSYNQSNMEIVGQYNLENNFVALSYAKAGKAAVANTGATQVSLKLGHNFSKKVEGFLAYTNLKNDAVAAAGTGGAYGLNSSAIFGTAAQQIASTQSAFGAGLIVSF